MSKLKSAVAATVGRPLPRFLLMRTGISLLLILGITIVTFTLTNLVPADPVQAALGDAASQNEAVVQAFRERMGLDKPLYVQYFIYLGNLLQGDLGRSTMTQQPVAQELMKAFPATIELGLFAVVLATIVGLLLGLFAALNRRTWIDGAVRFFSTFGISVPSFWLALVSYYVFFYLLHWAPGSGRLSPTLAPPPRVTGLYTVDALIAGNFPVFVDAIAHLVLPAIVLALFTIGLLTRFSRTAVLEVLDQEYVKAARAKGLPRHTIVFGYILRGALLPIVTMLGLIFGSLLSGTVLVENIFSWNGLGQFAYNAATNLDLPSIMAAGLAVGIVYIVLNLIVDVAYGFIDPRVRLQ